jgi:hypothetical protein
MINMTNSPEAAEIKKLKNLLSGYKKRSISPPTPRQKLTIANEATRIRMISRKSVFLKISKAIIILSKTDF